MLVAMANCNDRGYEHSSGHCNCDDGWTGADCSLKINPLEDGYKETFSSLGPKWYNFEYRADTSKTVLELKSQSKMDVFVGQV